MPDFFRPIPIATQVSSSDSSRSSSRSSASSSGSSSPSSREGPYQEDVRDYTSEWALASGDASGFSAGIAPIDVETMEVGDPIELPAAAKGIAVDHAGFIWTVPGQVNQAFRIDPETGDHDVVDGLSQPYTYSDMTGWALHNVACNPAG